MFIAADDGTLSGDKEERERKLAERRLFEIDQYYHLIEPYTFRTVFIDISGMRLLIGKNKISEIAFKLNLENKIK